MILIALYIDDLRVTVSEGLVKWVNARYLQGIDIVNTDIEIMRGGDCRQADESLQSTTNAIRSDSVNAVSQVPGFLNLVEPTKHVDTKYRYVQQMTVQAVNALLTAGSSL